nr:hypothetical protein CFP56_12792 [Quercus suber]
MAHQHRFRFERDTEIVFVNVAATSVNLASDHHYRNWRRHILSPFLDLGLLEPQAQRDRPYTHNWWLTTFIVL